MSTKKTSRRHMIKTGILGAATLTTASVLGRTPSRPETDTASQATPEFAGQVAFVTGGARGIGLGAAEELARSGADIALFDIAKAQVPGVGYALASTDDLEAARTKIESLGVRCLAIRGDVRDRAALDAAVQQTVSAFGRLDMLIVNAGVTQVGVIEDFTPLELQAVYDINVLGAIKTVQAAAPTMQRQRSGRIVVLSSGLGRVGNALFPVYASTKWALIGFAKSAALAYGPDGVRCNVVAPGLVDTKLADNPYVLGAMLPDAAQPTFAQASEMSASGNPLGFGHLEVADIARAIKLFCSEATAKVTGEVFDVSAGANARSVA